MTGRSALPPLGSIAAVGLAGAMVWVALTTEEPLIKGAAVAPETHGQADDAGLVASEDVGQQVRLDPAILARPIFAETRRPAVRKVVAPKPAKPTPKVVPKVVVAKPKPPPPPRLEFHGTMTSASGRLALIGAETGLRDWHPTGARFGEWKLSEIGRHHIVLRNGSATHRVDLYRQ